MSTILPRFVSSMKAARFAAPKFLPQVLGSVGVTERRLSVFVAPVQSSSVRRFFSSDAKPEETPSAKPSEGETKAESAGERTKEQQLLDRVNELTQQVNEMKQDRLRMLAEMENVRAIARRDVENTKQYAIQSFAKQLLDIADTLNLAIDSVPAEALSDTNAHQLKNLHEGVTMTRTNLQKLFYAQGMKEFGAVGEKFDANRHEALFESHHDEYEHGHVFHVIKPGYQLRDRVLRPAKVGTVKKNKPAGDA